MASSSYVESNVLNAVEQWQAEWEKKYKEFVVRTMGLRQGLIARGRAGKVRGSTGRTVCGIGEPAEVYHIISVSLGE